MSCMAAALAAGARTQSRTIGFYNLMSDNTRHKAVEAYLPSVTLLRLICLANRIHSANLVVKNDFEQTAGVRRDTERKDIFTFALIV